VGLEKRNGDWKIVHEHTSLPIDMATGKATFPA
jgi:ketosteroid isomerase-like protein